MSTRFVPIVVALSFAGCASAPAPAPASRDEDRSLAGDPAPRADLAAILKDCYAVPSLEPPVGRELKVNGTALNAVQAKNVQWIGRCVVPYLPGTADEQATLAAKTAWWALREGILSRAPKNLYRYSNCHENGKDRIRSSSPLYVCPDPNSPWQVGVAAAQVPNYASKTIVAAEERIFPALDSRVTEAEILAWTATLAGHPKGTRTHDAIVRAKGRLKRSWILRNPLIGFVLVGESEVERECLIDKRKWCFNGKYPEAKNFSRTEKGMLRAIADLKEIFVTRAFE